MKAFQGLLFKNNLFFLCRICCLRKQILLFSADPVLVHKVTLLFFYAFCLLSAFSGVELSGSPYSL